MKKTKKILLASLIVCLALFLSVAGCLYYAYTHPHVIRPLVENALSRVTQTRVTIKDLSYAFDPLHVQLKDLSMEPVDQGRSLSVRIPALRADLDLNGPFGNRVLTVKRLRVRGGSLTLLEGTDLPRPRRRRGEPSILRRTLGGLAGWAFFRRIRFESGDVSDGAMTARLGDVAVHLASVRAEVNRGEGVEISGALQFRRGKQALSFSTPHFRVITDPVVSLIDPRVQGRLVMDRATFRSPGSELDEVAVDTHLDYAHRTGDLEIRTAQIRVGGLHHVRGAGKDVRLSGVRLSLAGCFNRIKREGVFHSWALRLADRVQITGGAQCRFDPDFALSLASMEGVVVPEKMRDLFPHEALAGVIFSGPLAFQGDLHARRGKAGWIWQGHLKGRFQENRVGYQRNALQVGGLLSGTVAVEGRWPNPVFQAALSAEQMHFKTEDLSLSRCDGRLSLSATYPKIKLHDMTIQINGTEGLDLPFRVPLENLRIGIPGGEADVKEKSIRLPAVHLACAGLKNFQLTVKADPESQELSLEGRDTGVFAFLEKQHMLPSGLRLEGRESFRLEARREEKTRWAFSSNAHVEACRYENGDGSAMGENLSFHAGVEGRFFQKDRKIMATATWRVDRGELLHDRFYLDLEKNGLFSSMAGTYRIPAQRLELGTSLFRLKNLLTLRVQGTFPVKDRNQPLRLTLRLPTVPIQPLFRQGILEPFRTEKPFLSDLMLDGRLAADLDLSGRNRDWQVRGKVMFQDGALSIKDRAFALQGIHLDLPVWFGNPPLEGRDHSLEGRLAVRSVQCPPLPVQSIGMPLRGRPNGLNVPGPTTLRVPGGTLKMGPVRLTGLTGPSPRLQTSLALDTVELAPVFTGLWPRPVQGVMEGVLDPVVFEGDGIRTSGGLNIKAFGGEIMLSHLGASALWTPAPMLQLDARIRDLDLAALTTDTSFGRIEGTLEGSVRGLAFADGQPQGFELRLETVKRPGTAQKISVKAVDNIARISGSQGPFMGVAGMFSSLFKEFPYRKMGVQASLKNDIFKINGTIREGEREYFIRKGFFSGVDIINHNPDNRIRFKDMVKRIKRIQGKAGDPVIP